MITKFKVVDITCNACVELSRMVLGKIPGVKKVKVKKDGFSLVDSLNEIPKNEIQNALAKINKTAVFN